jgi:hypothetical protein
MASATSGVSVKRAMPRSSSGGALVVIEDHGQPAVVDGAHVNGSPDGFAVRVASQETAHSHHRYDRKRTGARGQKSEVSGQRVETAGRGRYSPEEGAGSRVRIANCDCAIAGMRECASASGRGGDGFRVFGPLAPWGRGIEIPLLESHGVASLKVSGAYLAHPRGKRRLQPWNT